MTDSLELSSEAYADQWDEVDQRQILKITDFESTIRHELETDAVGLATLPAVTLKSIGSQPGLFEMKERLGMGGMGEVRRARQPALQRDVAIKLVRSDAQTSQPSRILLREALVMGYLEHPNIVPIHVVGRDEGDELVVAMKRVEGITLADRVSGGYRLQQLEENLELLIAVCNATEFAHQRGVLHLDIKPSNIMIGSFGEVYLVDWGTAVAWREDVPSTIPRPLNDGLIRGTPAYMAPEMVSAAPSTPETDVFLLGGVLHAILAGHGPNVGDSAEAVLECAFISPRRELPDAVPDELADILHKSLARRPSERYETAGALRDALTAYLKSRTAREMLDSAKRTRANFTDLIAAEAPKAQVYGAFGAARQLLVDAQHAAPDPSYARAELQVLIETMCDWELANNNPAGAEALLHDLPQLNPQLRERIRLASEANLAERVELVELRRQIDPRVANNQKIAMWLAIAGVIGVIYVTPAALGYSPVPSEALVGHVGYLIALLIVTLGLRSRLMDTRVNREVVGLVWVLSLFGLFGRIAAYFGSIELGVAIGFDLALVATMGAFGAWIIDRRVLAAVPWHFAGAVAAFSMPEHGALIFGLSHFVALASVAATYALFREG